MKSDAVVLGAGVLGLSVAYHLANAGKRVVVVERESKLGQHASGKNAGMIRSLYHHPQLTDWAIRSMHLWPQEVHSSCFRKTGSLVVGRTLPGHHQEFFQQREVLTQSKTGEKKLPAVYTEKDGLLDPLPYLELLRGWAQELGVLFHFRESATEITASGGDWKIRTSTGKTLDTEWVINATGAWLNDVISRNNRDYTVDVQPFARHLFVLDGFQPEDMPYANSGFCWEEAAGWYMRLLGENTRLASICDRVPVQDMFSFQPTPNIGDILLQKLTEALPSAARNLKISDWWHCFRTYTEAQLPIWGEDPDLPGLFWLGAFGGFGMSTSFAATLDAASYICNTSVNISEDFLPEKNRMIPQLKKGNRSGFC